MRFLSTRRTPTKNVLVLGNKGCGKRSFVVSYKDQKMPPADLMSSVHTINVCEKSLITDQIMTIRFVLNRAPEGIKKIREPHYDLVLILSDTSCPTFQSDLDYYKELAAIHFNGIETILVGTKSDQTIFDNPTSPIHMISAKQSEGFEALKTAIHQALDRSYQPSVCRWLSSFF